MLRSIQYPGGKDADLGDIVDVTVDERGDIPLRAYREARMAIVRCNYRGQPQSEIVLKGLPRDFSDFRPQSHARSVPLVRSRAIARPTKALRE